MRDNVRITVLLSNTWEGIISLDSQAMVVPEDGICRQIHGLIGANAIKSP
jgi:hypothetical protein